MSETLLLLAGLGGFVLLLMILLFIGLAVNEWWTARQEARRAEREVALKKHLLERGLSVEEIERLIRVTEERPKEPETIEEEGEVAGEFAALLGGCQPSAIEEIFALFQATDLATRRAMLSAVTKMRDESEKGKITDEQIRAVVRGLARPAGPSTESATPANDLPALTDVAPRYTDSIRLSDRPGV